ncbi:MAG: tetratricopeptide repeat protein [Synechococcales cyanobacterium]
MGSSIETPRITKGLGVHQQDYYAALGIPITASSEQIADAYKKLARSKSLRPGFLGQTTPEGQYASWLLSRLINPAKELLTKDSERIEYDATLKVQIRRLMDEKNGDPWPTSPAAQALRTASDVQAAYEEAIAKAASIQFDNLYGILEQAGELSELNLTFLLCRTYPSYRASGTNRIPNSAAPATPTPPPTPTPNSPPTPTPLRPTSSFTSAPTTPAPVPVVPISVIRSTGAQAIPPSNPTLTPSETRFQQAVELAARGEHKQAIQFFSQAISKDPDRPEFYLERGISQLRLGNRLQARADIIKTLELSPKDKQARQILEEIDGPTVPPRPSSGTLPKAAPAPAPKKDDKGDKGKNQGGGFFGGLFGRK